jgi:Flp pilus assembly protein TadD
MRTAPLAQAAFWQREFDLNPADAEAGVRLAAALRAMGRTMSGATAQQVLWSSPTHVDALNEFARARIASARASTPSSPLKRVRQLQPTTGATLP